MKTKFTKPILYGYMVIFMIISLSSLGYYLDSINPTTIHSSITCYNPTSESPHEDAAWNLDSCYWFVDDPYIPYELQLVLDYCSDSYHYSDDLLVFTNETHYIDNVDCEWIVSLDWKNIKNNGFFDPGGTFILDSTSLPSEQLQKVLDNCDCQESDQTPCPFPLLAYSNGTHSINNIDCEWQSFTSVLSIEWARLSYPYDAAADIKVIAPEMNLESEAVDNFDISVFSDTDSKGLDLTVTETDDDTGVFMGMAFFSSDNLSSGHRLQVSEGDTVTATYGNIEDYTIIRTPEVP